MRRDRRDRLEGGKKRTPAEGGCRGATLEGVGVFVLYMSVDERVWGWHERAARSASTRSDSFGRRGEWPERSGGQRGRRAPGAERPSGGSPLKYEVAEFTEPHSCDAGGGRKRRLADVSVANGDNRAQLPGGRGMWRPIARIRAKGWNGHARPRRLDERLHHQHGVDSWCIEAGLAHTLLPEASSMCDSYRGVG